MADSSDQSGNAQSSAAEQQVAATAKADVQSLLNEARSDAHDQINNAVTAAEKLLAHAAGDATALLHEGEIAAVDLVVSKIPNQTVANETKFFANAVISAAGGPLDAAATAAIRSGLAWAEAELKHLQSSLNF